MAGFYFRQVFVFFAFIWVAHAHTAIFNFMVDNKRLELKKYIRPFYDPYNFPVKDVNSKDIVCRTSDMSSKNTDTCDVTAGSKVGVVFRTGESSEKIVLSRSHKGPCLVYLAPMESNGEGDVWFKIFEEGYDKATDQWCSEHVIDAKGELAIPLPSDIANGEYLLRAEIIALHAADSVGGAEFYSNCVQIKVSGGGSAKPKGVSIPGVYKADDPGIHIDIHEKIESYPIPGPKVYVSGSSNNSSESNGSGGSSGSGSGSDKNEKPSTPDNGKDEELNSSDGDSGADPEPTTNEVPPPRCKPTRKR